MRPPALAPTCTSPSFMNCTLPVAETLATVVSELSQRTAAPCTTFPRPSRTRASICLASPAITVVVSGETRIALMAFSLIAASVVPISPQLVAEAIAANANPAKAGRLIFR